MSRIGFGAAMGCIALAGLLALAGPARAQNEVKSATLDAVKKRGQLICGVDTGIPGYAFQDSKGEWQGLDIALCRALADAMLGSPTKVKYHRHHVEGPLLRAAIGRDRRADPRLRAHLHPQYAAWPGRAGGQFLHRPDLHGAQEPGRRAHQGPERRHDLPADRHHAGDQHRRLQPGQQHQDQHAAVRQARGGLRRRRCRPMRRLHRRRRLGRRGAIHHEAAGRLDLPAGDDRRPAAARSVHPPGRRGLDAAGEVGALRDARRRGARHHARPMSIR